MILIALMMEAARTSETSVDIQLRKRQYIPEDYELQRRHVFNPEIFLLFLNSGDMAGKSDNSMSHTRTDVTAPVTPRAQCVGVVNTQLQAFNSVL
jgi:hypothetical protein